ncbi:MAG: DUF4864 domain-containing protein [Alphaproteobacteria bacterium]|nr:DUF4864 domain-containing protein [Alphaproteobacteria bacterium]
MKCRVLVLLYALLSLPVTASAAALAQTAEPDPAAHAATFRTVIEAQMAAFARDDGAAAFAFAAPEIQRLFATPERFMAMVRTGFQPVYRPTNVAFETPIRVPAPDGAGNALAQPVRVTGPDGKPVLAMYHMAQQPDGSWRIAGVVLRALEEREG